MLFTDYLGAVDSDYVRAVSRKSFTAAVARVMVPGIKYDTMPIFAGPQGCGKSTFLRIMGKAWYSDSLTTFEGKDAYELEGIKENAKTKLTEMSEKAKVKLNDKILALEINRGRAIAKLENQKADIQRQLVEVRATARKEMSRIKAEGKITTKEAVANERMRGSWLEEKARNLEKTKAEQRRILERQRKIESFEKTKTFKVLKKLNARVNSKVAGKALRPEYREMGKELLANIDLVARGMSENTKLKLEKTLAFIEKMQEAGTPVNAEIVAAVQRLDKITVSELTPYEIKDLENTANNIMHLNDTQNEMLATSKKFNLNTISESAIDTIGKYVKQNKDFEATTGMGRFLSNAKAFFEWQNLSPIYFFDKFSAWGNNGMRVIGDLLIGADGKQQKFLQTSREFFREFLKDNAEDMKTWRGEKSKKTFRLQSGKTLILTPMNVLELYNHMKNKENQAHVLGGGLREPNANESKKVTVKDVEDILATLTPKMKEYADLVEKYYDTISKDAINQTSMQTDGYELATVERYYPIKTDTLDRALDLEKENITEWFTKSFGFTNARTNSRNGIVLNDMENTVNRSINEVSYYQAMAAPMRDMNRILNHANEDGVTFRQTLRLKLGKDGEAYFINYLKDLQGGAQFETQAGIEKGLNAITNNFARSAIGGIKPGLWVQQFAATIGGLAELDAKYMTNLNTLKLPDIKLMAKYSPFAYMRTQGYVSADLGAIHAVNKSSKLDLLTAPIEKLDTMATGFIWNAVELEIKDKYPSLEVGSDEFYEKVARRWEGIIMRTQQNYNVSARPPIYRNKNAIVRGITMFSSWSNQGYNRLLNGFARSKYTGDMRYAARATSVLLLETVVSGMLWTFIGNLLKRPEDKEKDYLERFIMDVLGFIPGLSLISGKLIQGYDLGIGAFSNVNKLLDAFKKADGLYNPENGETPAGVMKNLITTTADFFGLAGTNIVKPLEGMLNKVSPQLYYEWFNLYNNLDEAKAKYHPFLLAELKKDNSKLLPFIAEDMKFSGVSESSILTYLKKNDYNTDYSEKDGVKTFRDSRVQSFFNSYNDKTVDGKVSAYSDKTKQQLIKSGLDESVASSISDIYKDAQSNKVLPTTPPQKLTYEDGDAEVTVNLTEKQIKDYTDKFNAYVNANFDGVSDLDGLKKLYSEGRKTAKEEIVSQLK